MRTPWLFCTALLAAGLQFGCAHSPLRTAQAADTKPPKRTCEKNKDCKIDVYVSLGANQECQVQLLVGLVSIARGAKVNVVWTLKPVDDEAEAFEYRFDPAAGVTIAGNDPNSDFELIGANGNGQKFTWKSKNKRPTPAYDYELLVQRRANGSVQWFDCTRLDPKIINYGEEG